MNPIVRNVLAVLAGAIVGSVVNMSLIMISTSIIPAPVGADVTTPEGLKAALPLFEPKHFLFPFLAHALGTLVGAVVAALIAGSNKFRIALVIGFLFLIGGITNAIMLPAPMWFIAVDLIFAYIPMAWIGGKIGAGRPSQAKSVE